MKDIETEGLGAKPCENQEKNRAREEAIESFRSYLQALSRDKGTIQAYVRELGKFVAWLLQRGITDLRGVRRSDIEAYQAYLVGSGRYTTFTIHIKIRSIRRFYEHMEKGGKVLVNPAAGLRLPRVECTLPRAILTKDEAERLLGMPDLAKPEGIRDRAMLEILYSTGIRVGELCSLLLGDVDLNNGVVRINCGKGAKDRVVPIGHTAAECTARYLREVRSRFVRGSSGNALFLGHHGVPFKTFGVEILVRKYARKAEIAKTVTPHTLRHTCATHLIAGGADIVHVQRILGHSSLTTTQIYVRVAQREVKDMHDRCHPSERETPPGPLPIPHRLRQRYEIGDSCDDE